MENNISKMIENKIGVFYTCYTEKAAVEFSLDMLFEIYPEIRVYLVSDGGSDYSFLNYKPYRNNLKTLLEDDTRGKIPTFTPDDFRIDENLSYLKYSIKVFLDRIKRSIEFTDSEYTLVMEPDVLVRGKLNIPEGSIFLGSRVNSGLNDELRNVIRSVPGAIDVNNWGATPAIFRNQDFLKACDLIMNEDGLLDKICNSEYRLAYYDVLFAVIFALIGVSEEINKDIVECFRDPNWMNSHKPLVHQYRAKYPLSTEGYNGTHILNNNGLKDSWLWER
jgi:hypothetical protein